MPPKGSKKQPEETVTIQPSVCTIPKHLVERGKAVSQREMIELSYEFTIPDFNLLPQDTGHFLTSPVFFAKSHPNICWCLQVYPKGDCEDTKDHISLFVARVYRSKADLPVIARCKFSLFSNGREMINRWTPPLQFNIDMKNDGWGMPKFINLNRIESNNNNEEHQIKIICHLICEAQRLWVTSFPKTLENGCTSLQNQEQQVVELSYDWIIEEPSFLPQKNGECFYSPVFYATGEDSVRWRLKIYPKGAGEESNGFLSLHLERMFRDKTSNEPPVAVKLSFTAFKNGWKIFSNSEEMQLFGREPVASSFGWDKVEQVSVLEAIKRPTGVDELKISCHLIYAA